MAKQNFCLAHVNNPAVAMCNRCHKPVCSVCVVQSEAGQFCSEQCQRGYEHYFASKPHTGRRRNILSTLIGMAIPLGLLYGLIYYLGRIKGVAWAKMVLEYLGV